MVCKDIEGVCDDEEEFGQAVESAVVLDDEARRLLHRATLHNDAKYPTIQRFPHFLVPETALARQVPNHKLFLIHSCRAVPRLSCNTKAVAVANAQWSYKPAPLAPDGL